MQFTVLVLSSGQNKQLPALLVRKPRTALFKAIGPVTTTSEQSDHDQLRLVRAKGQVMIDLSRMGQGIQRQRTDSVLPERLCLRV